MQLCGQRFDVRCSSSRTSVASSERKRGGCESTEARALAVAEVPSRVSPRAYFGLETVTNWHLGYPSTAGDPIQFTYGSGSLPMHSNSEPIAMTAELPLCLCMLQRVLLRILLHCRYEDQSDGMLSNCHFAFVYCSEYCYEYCCIVNMKVNRMECFGRNHRSPTWPHILKYTANTRPRPS